MGDKKYGILYYDKIEFQSNSPLYRVKALKNFADVKRGEYGGYIQSASNLSQEGDCWVYQAACVCDNAEVSGNAKIMGPSKICKNAIVTGGNINRYEEIGYDAYIESDNDHTCILNIFNGKNITFYRNTNKEIMVCTNDYNNTIENFLNFVVKVEPNEGKRTIYSYALAFAIGKFNVAKDISEISSDWGRAIPDNVLSGMNGFGNGKCITGDFSLFSR